MWCVWVRDELAQSRRAEVPEWLRTRRPKQARAMHEAQARADTWVALLERALGTTGVASTSSAVPIAETVQHPRHALLLAQGTHSPALYVVITGAVLVHFRSAPSAPSVHVVRNPSRHCMPSRCLL